MLATIGGAALACGMAAPASGQDYYIGSVFLTANNFCPRGTLVADGQLRSIAEDTTLYVLYGTTYGGDGQTTFGLPDLRSRTPVGAGNGGPGRQPLPLGSVVGVESVTLTQAQMAPHTHTAFLRASSSAADTTTLIGNALGVSGGTATNLTRYSTVAGANFLNASAVTLDPAGGSQPVDIRNPVLGMRYCIIDNGIFPSQN